MAQLVKSAARLRSIPVRFRYLFLLATVFFGSSFVIISISNRTEIFLVNNELPLRNLELHHYQVHPEARYTIKTEGCTIPGLIPLDDSVKPFNQPPTELKNCPNVNHSLLLHNETHIWVDTNMLQHYNVVSEANFSCCYKSFYRPASVRDVYSDSVDDRVLYEPCLVFTDYIEVAHEFVKVNCDTDLKTVYEQYFLFAKKKPLQFYNPRSNTPKSRVNQTSAPVDYYNVIVMGIDAISRLNFYRTMPKTLAFLKSKGAVELLGYNKVGDNTFPNLTPILLGLKENELKRTCWPHNNANFDNCPFIWQWFKDAGFYTALGEDSAHLGTFNFAKYGFIRKPTDYYIRTFMHEAEMNVGNNKDFNSYICMGNKYFFKVLLDYIEDLTSTLRQSKLFGFFWEVTMSHDYLNYPMAMDDSYERFLERLDSFNYLDNTVLILLSDHGIRWGAIRLTKQGRLEERLPFVHVLLPPSFRENFNLAYENIKENSKRLTTPFDMYATISDLINLDTITDENIKQRSETSYSTNRSISLFLPIPRNRTCKTASIDDHWCTCHKSIKLATDSNEARTVAEELVKQVNSILLQHPQCAQLTLAKVVEVSEMLVGQPMKAEVGWREFMAVVKTNPGGGVFEGTLRHREDKQWHAAGTVSRLNLYGDQSKCVDHYQIKLYCYCH